MLGEGLSSWVGTYGEEGQAQCSPAVLQRQDPDGLQGGTVMGQKNAFLAKQEAARQKCFEIACDTTSQQFFDYMCIVLNDPEIMGKDTFGAKRLLKIHDAMKALDREYSEAWCGGQESDWYQEQLDRRLRSIFGKIAPFRERYPYLKEWDYRKPLKGNAKK